MRRRGLATAVALLVICATARIRLGATHPARPSESFELWCNPENPLEPLDPNDRDGDGIRDSDAARDVLDAVGSACAKAEILVLLDRSSSMSRWPTRTHSHYREALEAIDEIARRAGDERVEVIGFPAPSRARGGPCDVTAASAVDAVPGWGKPGAHDRTPLLEAMDAAVARIAGKPEGVVTRIVVLSDGFQDCGDHAGPYTTDELLSELSLRIAKVPGKTIGTPELQMFGKTHLLEANRLQAALDRLFATRPCGDGEPPSPEPPRPPIPPGDPPRPPLPPLRPPLPPHDPPDGWVRDPRTRPAAEEFLDVVAVGDDNRWFCSGVLVAGRPGHGSPDPMYVLTARHCLPATRIAAGSSDARAGAAIDVATAIPHPDKTVDAALLRLAAPVTRRTHLRRLRSDTNPPGGHLRLAGFGADDATGRHGAGDLHALDILASGGWGCDARAATATGCVSDHELVVRGNGVHDACRGDSGGPLFEQVGCEWRLIAITSRAIPSARRACGDGGIYTRVDAISDWIQSQTETR